jgi:hypothetical protein
MKSSNEDEGYATHVILVIIMCAQSDGETLREQLKVSSASFSLRIAEKYSMSDISIRVTRCSSTLGRTLCHTNVLHSSHQRSAARFKV